MMSGDIPCNAPCANRWCKYNSFGHCDDNAPCAAQVGGGCFRNPAPEREDETSDENENENTQEN